MGESMRLVARGGEGGCDLLYLSLFRDLCCAVLLYLYPILGQGLCPNRNIDACHPCNRDSGVFYHRLCKIDDVCRLGYHHHGRFSPRLFTMRFV